jgi:hypothetical protein
LNAFEKAPKIASLTPLLSANRKVTSKRSISNGSLETARTVRT